MPPHPYRCARYGETFRTAYDLLVSPGAPVTWLKRPIDGTDAFDLGGAYPCISVPDYRVLADDIDELRKSESVSVVFVANAFDETAVERILCSSGRLSLCRPFKTHYFVTFETPWRQHLSAHHRRELHAARSNGLVTRIRSVTSDYACCFWRLYEELIARHGISGIQALSPEIIAAQCALPGVVAVEALDGNTIIAASLWVYDAREAHIHLHAQVPAAYPLRAGYLIYEAALDYFSERVENVDLGGGAGLNDKADDGLARFKKGWSNASGRTYLCGEILDPDRYRALVEQRGTHGSCFFPQYRSPDLPSQSSAE